MNQQNAYERIGLALSEHVGLQLGDVSAIHTPEEFARIVEVAARNYKAGKRERARYDFDDDSNAGLERRAALGDAYPD